MMDVSIRNRLGCASIIALCAGLPPVGGAAAQTVPAQVSQSESVPDTGQMPEIIVTANKRTETLQKIPLTVQVLDSKVLEQHAVSTFQDYLKLIPSLTLQSTGPNITTIYLRGISAGDNMNHSGPQPSVGVYLNEAPLTTISSTPQMHIYDMERIEVLPGPQGTLYGASSQAGTVRLLTNKPDTSRFSAGYSIEGNSVKHGNQGYILDGFVNIPVSDNIALRLVAFKQHDAGWIDNTFGTATFATSGTTINNGNFLSSESKGVNRVDTYGGRVALKIDLNDNWTVMPSLHVEDVKTPSGVPGYRVGSDRQTQLFQTDRVHNKWGQAALTVNGRIGNFDLTYAGAYFFKEEQQHVDYTDYSIAYDQAYGSGVNWRDSAGNILSTPLVNQNNNDFFRKISNEVRLASPATNRLRFQVGAFQEYQVRHIQDNYNIPGFSTTLSVPGWPSTYWLTKSRRSDRDYAAFAEVSFDITPALTLTGGGRLYKYDNRLYGFFGFSQNYQQLTGFGSGMGANGQNCQAGKSYFYRTAAPCVNLDKKAKGSGETHKINLNYKFDDMRMVYFTYSTGYRPGGVNRNSALPPYEPDTLDNFEIGLKSQWFDRRLTLNLALYNERLKNFQYAFYGLNNLTQIQNAPSANIKGLEASVAFRPVKALTISGDLTLLDPHLDQNVCRSNPTTGAIVKNCSDAVAVALKGTQLPFTAKVKSNLTARYGFDLSSDYHAYIQGSVAYRAKQTLGLRIADQQALGELPAFTSFDVSAGVTYNNISLDLFVKNLTDKRGLLNRYSRCNNSVCLQQYDVSIQPRTVSVRLSQKF